MATIPAWIKGYWGVVESAAATRMGSGSLFAAINAQRLTNGTDALSGVDAIQMGQIYSLAVQQRNAADSFQTAFNALQGAVGAEAELFADAPIDSTMVATTLRSASAAILAVAPNYTIRYQYSYIDIEGNTTIGYGYIHNVTLEGASVGDVVTIIQAQITANITTPTLTSLGPGSTYTFTGRANLLML